LGGRERRGPAMFVPAGAPVSSLMIRRGADLLGPLSTAELQ
jgi:hypothetical protein